MAAPLIGLAFEGLLGEALQGDLERAGYRVERSTRLSTLQRLIAEDRVRAWLFDARCEATLEQLLPSRQFLLPADNPPDVADRMGYSRWVAGLIRQLDQAVDTLGPAPGDSAESTVWGDTQAVWLLAGSAGATTAVQEFLNAFRQPPPVGFLYAQHYDPRRQEQLRDFCLENPRFSLHVAEGQCQIQPGRILMVPPRSRVTISAFGVMSTTRSDWGGQHSPSIDELLVILAAARLQAAGVIVFSGMGCDGARSLSQFHAAGGTVWAQVPETAICGAMPQAAIDTGLVQRSASPAHLAWALEHLYNC